MTGIQGENGEQRLSHNERGNAVLLEMISSISVVHINLSLTFEDIYDSWLSVMGAYASTFALRASEHPSLTIVSPSEMSDDTLLTLRPRMEGRCPRAVPRPRPPSYPEDAYE